MITGLANMIFCAPRALSVPDYYMEKAGAWKLIVDCLAPFIQNRKEPCAFAKQTSPGGMIHRTPLI